MFRVEDTNRHLLNNQFPDSGKQIKISIIHNPWRP